MRRLLHTDSLATRLALVLMAIVAATALATSLVGAVTTGNEAARSVDRFLRDRADDIAEGRRARPTGPAGRGPAGGPGARPAVDDDAVVQVIDQSGVVWSGSIDLPVDEADRALADAPGSDRIRTEVVDGEPYRVLTRHVGEGLAVMVARSLESTTALQSRVRTNALLIAALMAGVVGLGGWWAVQRVTRPLRDLTRRAETVAATQDLVTGLGPSLDRDDEIGRLASSFDEMLRALASSRDRQHRLVEDAAHELRTPLTSINANVDLLAHAPDLDPGTRQDMLSATRSELRQLNELVTEIVELATDARDAPSLRPIDLATVVTGAVTRFRERSSVPVELDAQPSPVVGDPDALARAVANLLSNAEKYGPAEGPISVAVVDGTVTVADRGPGVGDAEVERVFDRFYRGDAARAQPGSGLGLSIVEKIAADHDGRAWFHNRPEGGAEAGLTLPSMKPDG